MKIREIVKKYFPMAFDVEVEAIIWMCTGYPHAWRIPQDGNTWLECFEKQLCDAAKKSKANPQVALKQAEEEMDSSCSKRRKKEAESQIGLSVPSAVFDQKDIHPERLKGGFSAAQAAEHRKRGARDYHLRPIQSCPFYPENSNAAKEWRAGWLAEEKKFIEARVNHLSKLETLTPAEEKELRRLEIQTGTSQPKLHSFTYKAQGRRAFNAKKSIESCPYHPADSERAKHWRTGWLEEEKDKKKQDVYKNDFRAKGRRDFHSTGIGHCPFYPDGSDAVSAWVEGWLAEEKDWLESRLSHLKKMAHRTDEQKKEIESIEIRLRLAGHASQGYNYRAKGRRDFCLKKRFEDCPFYPENSYAASEWRIGWIATEKGYLQEYAASPSPEELEALS